MMLGGDGDGDALGRRMAVLAGIPLQVNPPPEGMVGRGGRGGRQLPSPLRGEGEREIPWGEQETRDLIAIRDDLERGHPKARGYRTLWEAVADAMRDRGYLRSPDQCKCKWKNLVNRYKGTETADPQIGRQCPFFDELNAVFVERAKSMRRLLLESESGASQPKKKLKRPVGDRFSDVFFDEDEHSIDDELLPRSRTKKTGMAGARQQQQHRATTWAGVEELLQEVLQQQRRMEEKWRGMVERRAEERRAMEQEWRGAMRELEQERAVLEQAWREREEQRREREERRAEKTEALLAALVDKLIKDDE
ncbi:trihelix transcription factor GT-3b-like [Zingiber officinale]|uniref:Myb-like domain-containing protein n=1 Tax=Zingiber officinale TaxID=94328 RepID=A0A8J5HEF1_ZINOF|nr:trihelix transcription factor GT-3b-like [Zingiber officinale]KAG6520148.1 hypothetical protein ZIOFF_017182 [Zingiber officinale]